MNEWKEEPLENITIFIKDGSHGSHRDCENGIPLLSAKDIVDGKVIIPDDCRRISQKDYDQMHSNYEIQQNDLALTIVGTIGRVALVEYIKQKFTFQRSVGLFRINSSMLNPVYCYHYFTSHEFQQALERSKNASAQGGVYLGELAKIKISYPKELTIQRRMAHILTNWDVVIEKTKAAISKYKAIKQGMLHDLFTRGVDLKTGKLRPKYEDAPTLYKESKLGMVPKEWGVDSLENITEKIGSGVTPTGGSEIYKSSGVLFIRSQNVLIGSLSIEDAVFITNEIDEMMESSRVKPFDVLLNITGASIGRCSYFPIELRSANVNQHVCIIRFINASKVLAVFASEFINSSFGQKQINRANAGGNRDGLNFQQIKSFHFPIIDHPELKIISSIIETQSNKFCAEQSYLRKLQMIKSGLMADLLSGKKRVSVPEEVLAVSN